jgi:EmrB/QacA subfamily drug resistance transporter
MVGAFSVVLSATIVNVAVPDVMGAFGIGQDRAQWMATGFLATMVAGQLLNAWIIGLLGERNALSVTLLVFILGGVISGLSPNMDFIVVGRIMQGFSAGIVQPLAMVTLFRVFPADRRATAMAIYGMGVTLAPGFGPAVGGLVIDSFSWRYIFFMPLPFCAVAILLGNLFMPSRDPEARKPIFDWTGFTLLCTALACLMWGIGNGQREGWSSTTIILVFGLCLVCGIGFVLAQLRADTPLLDLTLFRNPAFAFGALLGFVFGMGNFSTSYAIPVFVQTVQNFTATAAGFALLPAGVVLLLLFPLTGRISDKLPYQVPIMSGLIVFSIAALLMSQSDVNTPFLTVVLITIMGRVGLTFIMPSLNAAVLGALTPEQLNRGTGGLNFIRQLGGAAGVNALVAILEQRTVFHAEALTATQTAGNVTNQEFLSQVGDLLGEAGVPEALHEPGALHYLGQVVYAQANTFAFQDGFIIIAAVFASALIPAWILGRSTRKR